MKKRHRHQGMRTVLLTLVFATAAVNASQSLVLCLGCDGHVAVEPAGHQCCSRTPVQAPDPAEPHQHIADDHCRPCTDIPITLWTPVHWAGSPVVKAFAGAPMACLPPLHPTDALSALPEWSGSPPPTSYHAPLSSIVLQV